MQCGSRGSCHIIIICNMLYDGARSFDRFTRSHDLVVITQKGSKNRTRPTRRDCFNQSGRLVLSKEKPVRRSKGTFSFTRPFYGRVIASIKSPRCLSSDISPGCHSNPVITNTPRPPPPGWHGRVQLTSCPVGS